MSGIVYLNGSLLPLEEAGISVMDYGFLYGFGLFETMRAYGGRVFRLEAHLDRLAGSANALALSVDTDRLKAAVADVVWANGLTSARVRIILSIGEGGATPDPASCRRPTTLVAATRYQPYPEVTYQKGFQTIVSSVRRNSQSPLAKLKSLNYLESMLARGEARAGGADEAICLNERGFLAEASMSNVFLVTGGSLRTPGRESGILPGITRETVLELARRMGINCVEQDIELAELCQAQEALLTNSLIEVMPLTRIGDKRIGDGVPGPVTRKLMAAYRDLVSAGGR